MTQRNISRATSRITECLFHVVVFVFLIYFPLTFVLVEFFFALLLMLWLLSFCSCRKYLKDEEQ